jgi:hypothetical protein
MVGAVELQSHARFNEAEAFAPIRYLADCIIVTSGFKFSGHTGRRRNRKASGHERGAVAQSWVRR